MHLDHASILIWIRICKYFTTFKVKDKLWKLWWNNNAAKCYHVEACDEFTKPNDPHRAKSFWEMIWLYKKLVINKVTVQNIIDSVYKPMERVANEQRHNNIPHYAYYIVFIYEKVPGVTNPYIKCFRIYPSSLSSHVCLSLSYGTPLRTFNKEIDTNELKHLLIDIIARKGISSDLPIPLSNIKHIMWKIKVINVNADNLIAHLELSTGIQKFHHTPLPQLQ